MCEHKYKVEKRSGKKEKHHVRHVVHVHHSFHFDVLQPTIVQVDAVLTLEPGQQGQARTRSGYFTLRGPPARR